MPRVRMTDLSVFSVTRSCSKNGVISRLLAENTKANNVQRMTESRVSKAELVASMSYSKVRPQEIH